MTNAEVELMNRIAEEDSLELAPGQSDAMSAQVNSAIGKILGNPIFKAQFNLNVSVKYYSHAAPATPVLVAAAALSAAQKTYIPLFLFGNSDIASNYRKARQLITASGWDNTGIAVFTGGSSNVVQGHYQASVLQASGRLAAGEPEPGDVLVIIPQSGWVPGAAGTTQTAEVLIKCPQVGYMTLVDALNSDRFIINMIRFVVDSTQTAQFSNQIQLIKQSLFGLFGQNTIDPQTFVTANTYNKNIADIPSTIKMDKNMILGTLANYDTLGLSFTITVLSFNKLT